MCGIVGIIDFKQSKERINQSVLKKMSDEIIHRGPDSDGLFISENNKCGLAFRRLSIIDLTNDSNQPMKSINNNSTIVFNGEIYNHKEVKKQLLTDGFKYKSSGDTETILNAFQAYGETALEKLNGMWAFAIWDEDKQELFASRDRIGIKPFYYYYKDELFIFASEIKSILSHPQVRKELNIDEIPNYLNFGASSNKFSLFSYINKLPAGHFFKLSKNGELVIKRYWNPFNKTNNTFSMDYNDIYEELINQLRRSINDRMMSEVPFGVFLSGGIDSSLNTALMSEIVDRPVDSYTVGFKDLQKYNELEFAHQIAELYKTNHKDILIDESDAFEVLETLPYYEDEPNADPVCIPLYFLSKLTKESKTTVVQVGEGSDEQFCGYKWMLRDYNFINSYYKTFNSLPKILRTATYSIAKPILNYNNLELASDFIRRGVNKEKFYWSGQSVFSPEHQSKLFSDNFKYLKEFPYSYVNNIYKDLNNLYPEADTLQQMMFTELTQRLPEMLLMRVDKIGMSQSIEARVPFLDHRLVEFTISIPERIKVPDNKTTKYLLKKAVEPILPNNIIYRKKQGFAAPVNEWLRTTWYDYAYDNIINSDFAKLGILNINYIKKLLINHKKAKVNAGALIYSLLNLNLWYKVFFK